MVLDTLSILRHNLTIKTNSRSLRESTPTGLRALIHRTRVLLPGVSDLPILVRVPGLLTRVGDLVAGRLVRILNLLAGGTILVRVHLALVPVLVGIDLALVAGLIRILNLLLPVVSGLIRVLDLSLVSTLVGVPDLTLVAGLVRVLDAVGSVDRSNRSILSVLKLKFI